MACATLTVFPICGVFKEELTYIAFPDGILAQGTCRVACRVDGMSNPQIERERVPVEFCVEETLPDAPWAIKSCSAKDLAAKGFLPEAIDVLVDIANEWIATHDTWRQPD